MTTTTLTRARPSTSTRARTASAAPSSSGYVLLLAVLLVLNLVGLVMVLSASSVVALEHEGSPYYYFVRQLMWLALGGVIFFVTWRVDYRRWRALATPALVGTVFLLALVFVPGLGVNANGSSRWLGYGNFSIQPSEVAKLAVLLFVADLLARRRQRITDLRVTLRPVIAVFGLVGGLILMQPNLGTTIVLAAIVLAVLFTAGTPFTPLARTAAFGVAAATFLAFSKSYRRARLLAFLHPWQDPLGIGYQNIQSQVSLASGGWFGVGLGASRAKWGFLPYAHTDFIFAIIGEELGLVGALLVVSLFIALGVLGVRAAMMASDPFGRLMAIGITTWFCVQAFVNIGAVIGVLPITGVPLPFISFGGSSLLATMAAAGILGNVAGQVRPAGQTARRG